MALSFLCAVVVVLGDDYKETAECRGEYKMVEKQLLRRPSVRPIAPVAKDPCRIASLPARGAVLVEVVQQLDGGGPAAAAWYLLPHSLELVVDDAVIVDLSAVEVGHVGGPLHALGALSVFLYHAINDSSPPSSRSSLIGSLDHIPVVGAPAEFRATCNPAT